MIKKTDISPCSNTALFDIEGAILKELFSPFEFPWEVLDSLSTYLKNFFHKNKRPSSKAQIAPQAVLINSDNIWFGDRVIVEPGAYIEGPCIFGEGTIIRHGAYVRGNVVTGKGCVIGHTTEIKGSILLNSAKAAHFAYIGDSILGNHVNLGAGTRLANLRLDKGIVSVRVGKEKIVTGRKKLGAILGDGAQTGCNCVANPGTVFSRGVLAHPLTNPSGFLKENVKISK